MAEKDRAVSDTGPILHLHEINAIKAMDLFSIYVPEEVSEEMIKLRKKRFGILLMLKPKYKDISKLIAIENFIDIAESQAIALALQERIKLFFTDDLEARNIGKRYGLEVHGTLGILLRSFREGIFKKDEAIRNVIALYENSSLFITSDLVKWTIDRINEFQEC